MEREFEYRGITWRDATTYSRGDEERKPTLWEATPRGVRITITNGHIL